jgi:transcriptional regulator with XRE-family HTH domain
VAAGTPIGTKIAKRRQVLGITQEDLAAELSRLTGRRVSKSTVANWERGKHYPQRYLGAIEEVLGISLDDDDTLPDPVQEAIRAIREIEWLSPGDKEALVAEYRQRHRPHRAAG